MHFLNNKFSRVTRNNAEKFWKIGRDRPEVVGIVGNRFAITLLGNLTSVIISLCFLRAASRATEGAAQFQVFSKVRISFKKLKKYDFNFLQS